MEVFAMTKDEKITNERMSINLQMLKDITLNDCINYIGHDELENKVKNIINYYINKHAISKEMDVDEYLEKLLQNTLLKIGSSKVWVQHRKKYNLGQRDLYIIIRKYLYFADNTII